MQTEMSPGQLLGRRLLLFTAAGGNVPDARKLARSRAWDDGHVDQVDRALVAGVGSAGGFLIPPDQHRALIELLRVRAVIRSLGARTLPMSHGNLSMPRLSTTAGGIYVGEAVATAAAQPGFGQVRWTAKKLMGLVPISNDLLLFASPDADQAALEDLAAAIAVSEDAAFIRGLGTQYSPRGIRYWASSGNIFASAGTSFANIQTDLEAALSALETANVRMIDPAWIMNPRSKNSIRMLQATTGSYIFRDEIDVNKTLMGFKFGATNGVPSNLGSGANQAELYLVDMADAVIAESPELAISLAGKAAYVNSTGALQSGFAQDVSVLKVVAHQDFALRHDVSASVITGILY